MLLYNPLRSKAFWGGLLAAVGRIISDPKDFTAWMEAVGILVAVVGLRDGAAKAEATATIAVEQSTEALENSQPKRP